MRSGPDLLDTGRRVRLTGVEVGDTTPSRWQWSTPVTSRPWTCGSPCASRWASCRPATATAGTAPTRCSPPWSSAPCGGRSRPASGTSCGAGFATTVGPATLGSKRITQLVEPLASAGPLPSGVKLKSRDADQALRLRPVGRSARRDPGRGDRRRRPDLPGEVQGAFDIVANGAAVTGAVGDTVRVTVGLRNDGSGRAGRHASPATASARSSSPHPPGSPCWPPRRAAG